MRENKRTFCIIHYFKTDKSIWESILVFFLCTQLMWTCSGCIFILGKIVLTHLSLFECFFMAHLYGNQCVKTISQVKFELFFLHIHLSFLCSKTMQQKLLRQVRSGFEVVKWNSVEKFSFFIFVYILRFNNKVFPMEHFAWTNSNEFVRL